MRTQICLLSMAVIAIVTPQALAQVGLTYTVSLDKSEYIPNETVNWQITVSSNELIGTLTANLSDDTGEVLSPGSIGPAFASYDLQDGGSWNGATSQLEDIEVAELFDLAGDTVASGLLASGSFQATVLGLHSLAINVSKPDQNTYVNPNPPPNAEVYDTIELLDASFTVVPEPSSCAIAMLGLLGLAAFAGRRGQLSESGVS